VNIAPETNETARINEGVLKQLVGGDTMYFDRKGIPGFDAKPTTRLMIATNNRPPINDRSDGVWRRMAYLPFSVTIAPEEQDPELAQKLKTEIQGILNWALDGHRSLYQRGRFIEPAVSKAAIKDYRGESNPAGTFLREECRFDISARTSVESAYLSYKEWARTNGHQPLNNAQFGKEVAKVYPGVKRVRPNAARGRSLLDVSGACDGGWGGRLGRGRVSSRDCTKEGRLETGLPGGGYLGQPRTFRRRLAAPPTT
jgi:putative DNA primase/helicase